MLALADGNRDIDLFADLPERMVALGWNRLIEPVDVTGILESVAQADGCRNVEAAM